MFEAMKSGCHVICNQWKLSDEIQTSNHFVFIQGCRKWRGGGQLIQVHHITTWPPPWIFRPCDGPVIYYWNLLTTQKRPWQVHIFSLIRLFDLNLLNGIRLIILKASSYFVWEKGINEGGRELVCIGIASMLLVVSILRGGLLGVEGSSSSCNGKNRRSHHHQHTLVAWLLVLQS